MSVRVVKEGKLPEDQVYTGTCRRCGCEVEVLYSNFLQALYGFSHPCPTEGCGCLITCKPKSEQERYVDTDKVKYTERTEKRSLKKQEWRTGYKGLTHSTTIYHPEEVEDPTPECMYYYVKPDRSRMLADEARKYLRGEL